jgi:hypothetical protein
MSHAAVPVDADPRVEQSADDVLEAATGTT